MVTVMSFLLSLPRGNWLLLKKIQQMYVLEIDFQTVKETHEFFYKFSTSIIFIKNLYISTKNLSKARIPMMFKCGFQ